MIYLFRRRILKFSFLIVIKISDASQRRHVVFGLLGFCGPVSGDTRSILETLRQITSALTASLLRRLCTGDYQSLLASGVGPSATSPGGSAFLFSESVFITVSIFSLKESLLFWLVSFHPKRALCPNRKGPLRQPHLTLAVHLRRLCPLQLVDCIYLYTDHQEHLLSLLTEVAEHQKGEGRLDFSTLLELYT